MGAEGSKILAVEKSMYNFTVVPFYLMLHIHGLNQTIDDMILFSSVTQSCPTLCNTMNRSTPDLPVHHQHLEFTQIHVHLVKTMVFPVVMYGSESWIIKKAEPKN